jgi:hypothetical protein
MALIVLFAMPFTRNGMKALSGEAAKKAYAIIFIIVKFIWDSHMLVLHNLTHPRKVVLPTLEKDDQINHK